MLDHGKYIKFYPQLFFLISYFLFQNILEENSYKIQNQSSHGQLASVARVAFGREKRNFERKSDTFRVYSKMSQSEKISLVVIAGIEPATLWV